MYTGRKKYFLEDTMKIKKKGQENGLLPLTYDYVFKAVFGDQRYIENLRGLLKASVESPEDDYEHLTIIDPFLKRLFKRDNSGVLDVKVQTKSGRLIDVEVQVNHLADFTPRLVYYNAKMITEQIKSGDDYGKIHQAINIAICDHVFLDDTDSYLNTFTINNVKTGEPFTDLVKYVIIELPKVPKEDDGNSIWPFAQSFKCKDEEDLMILAKKYPQVSTIAERLHDLSLSAYFRAVAEDKEKARRDAYAREKWVRMEERAEAKAEYAEIIKEQAAEIERLKHENEILKSK
jgi:predicted transposase/invertase (TIGR01784 family)